MYAQVYRARLASGASLRISTFFSTHRKYGTPTETAAPRKSKLWKSADEAIKDVKSGDVLLCGGVLAQPAFLVRIVSGVGTHQTAK
ncbi:hypothetical protein C0992_002260 [Termitomyces sp. T32_za158]|nr:hypothetical protein C0992_002260 [Termitomyces sp. T32_za158]